VVSLGVTVKNLEHSTQQIRQQDITTLQTAPFPHSPNNVISSSNGSSGDREAVGCSLLFRNVQKAGKHTI